MMTDIVERLRFEAFDAVNWDGETMKQWDKIRKQAETLPGSDLPRLMFQGLIESLAELMVESAFEIERLRNDAQSARTGGLDMHTVTESIYSDSNVIVPLADVQHIEKWDKHTVPGIKVITKHTRWDSQADIWANDIWISEPEATAFKAAWCRYRSELETDTLMDLSPSLPSAQCGGK